MSVDNFFFFTFILAFGVVLCCEKYDTFILHFALSCVLNICLYQKKMVREAAFGNLSEWLRPPGEEVPSGTQGPFCPRFIF